MVLRLRGEGALVVGEPPPPRRRNRRGKLPRGPGGRTPWRTPGGLPHGASARDNSTADGVDHVQSASRRPATTKAQLKDRCSGGWRLGATDPAGRPADDTLPPAARGDRPPSPWPTSAGVSSAALASDLLSAVAVAAVLDIEERRARADSATEAPRSCSTSVGASPATSPGCGRGRVTE